MTRRRLLVRLAFALLVAGAPLAAPAAGSDAVVVYKTPTCGCCSKWVAHLRANGFTVDAKDVDQAALDALKRERGVPERLASCHTALVGDYVIEGHVPAADVKRLLAERPAIVGLAVPGMPIGSPGMESPGRTPQPYAVVTFDRNANTTTFSRH